MSVTFYDPKNPTKHDEDYNVVGGGFEANFSNINARFILKAMGIEDKVLCGSMAARDMLEVLDRSEVGVRSFCLDEYRDYLLRAIKNIRQVAEEAASKNGEVHWG